MYIYKYNHIKNIRRSIKRRSIKRKSIKRKSIKRKSIKRKSIKRKSITISGGGGVFFLDKLSISDEIIKFSEKIKNQLINKITPTNYNQNGWFRKKVISDVPRGCFVNPAKFIIDDELPHIIELISDILDKKGLFVERKRELKSSDINVEIHYANAKDVNKPIGSGLVVHQDNDGGIYGLLHTFIVYLDTTGCIGGDLEIYKDDGRTIDKIIDVKTQTPEFKNIVMFDGGLFHKPQPITEGKRVIVSYQIRQADPSKSSKSKTSKSNPSKSTLKGGDEDSCPMVNYEEDAKNGSNWGV